MELDIHSYIPETVEVEIEDGKIDLERPSDDVLLEQDDWDVQG